MSTSDFTIDNGLVDGETIAKWTQEWWKWALSLPSDANPFTHPDGSFAGMNNNGPIYFIAGQSQTNEFNVPAGKPLLVPIRNFVDTPPEFLPSGALSFTDPAIKGTESSNCAIFNRSISNLEADIDGKPISNLLSHLENTSFFDAGTAAAGTLAVDPTYSLDVAPVGTHLDPAKSTGYWLMIDHLSPGEHTLHFAASWNSFNLSFGNVPNAAGSLDVTDRINVV
jgi:hypothetical protein